MLNGIVQTKENELMELQRRLDKNRGTHTSGFSQYQPNQSMTNQSEAESVRTQLDGLNQTLEEERNKSSTVLSEQVKELEEAKKKTEEGQDQAAKMRARMAELQNELEQTIKRIETIQRGGGGYGARANRGMNFAGSNGSRNSSVGSNNRSNNSQTRQNRQPYNANRPVPSYMRPKGQNSSDRFGSGQRNASGNRSGSHDRNTAKYLPRNYQPPHLRNSNNSATRVSPGRQGGQQVRSSGYGQPNSRVSPNRAG